MAHDDDSDDIQVFLNQETGEYVDADGNPVDVEEIDEKTTRFRFGRGRDPESDAERDRKRKQRERESALRERGSARRRKYLTYAIVVFGIISVYAFLQSCRAVSPNDVSAMVDERLESQGSNFPSGQAVMWAGQVVWTWGNWDEGQAKARQTLIAPFISQGMDSQAGWDGKGKQTLLGVQMDPEPEVLNANRAIIKGAYLIDDGTWRCLALKVFSTKPKSFSTTAMYAFTLSGNPTPIACSPTTGARQISKQKGARTDQNAAADLKLKFFPGFMAAWAASDQFALSQYLNDGTRTVGLSGAFRSDPKPTIEDVTVPIEGKGNTVGDTTTATVTVTWTTASGKSSLTSTYNVPMRRKGGQWFVSGEPAPSAQDPNVNGRAAANSGQQGTNGKDGDPNNPNSGTSLYPTPSITTPPSESEYRPGNIEDTPTPSS